MQRQVLVWQSKISWDLFFHNFSGISCFRYFKQKSPSTQAVMPSILMFNNNITNQQDATISVYWPFQSDVHVSGVNYGHPQEHFDCIYSWHGDMVKVKHLNHVNGQQQRRCIIPKAVNTVKCPFMLTLPCIVNQFYKSSNEMTLCILLFPVSRSTCFGR
jgi:hypothetical protein